MAQSALNLLAPGTMVPLSPAFSPVLVKGITIHPDQPFQFDFIVDAGDASLDAEEFKKETNKLIKYFLASLTLPEDQLWVNLSPYEEQRIIPEALGKTEMGRDLLAQDYILKQLTASLMYPEEEIGREFWHRVYERAQAQGGTTEIPVDTFNKVWIVPEKASVYVHNSSAFVVESHLKVLLEKDYVAFNRHLSSPSNLIVSEEKEGRDVLSGVSFEVVKEVLIPEIEREVNEGRHFAPLRQIYQAMILATWFKQNLKESILGRIYVDQNKTKGVEVEERGIPEKIYQQYLEAYQKGVYDYIKEEYDPTTQEMVPRKYFSGGADLSDVARLSEVRTAYEGPLPQRPFKVSFKLEPQVTPPETSDQPEVPYDKDDPNWRIAKYWALLEGDYIDEDLFNKYVEFLRSEELHEAPYADITQTMVQIVFKHPEYAQRAIEAMGKALVEVPKLSAAKFTFLAFQLSEFIEKDRVQIDDYLNWLSPVQRLSPIQQNIITAENLERLALIRPETFTPEKLEKLVSYFDVQGPVKYLLFYLTTRPGSLAKTRLKAGKILGDSQVFPLSIAFQKYFQNGKKKILVVHNMNDGQGDELIRNGTLIQALLDYNPQLEMTLVTGRSFLYDHPRIQIVSYQDLKKWTTQLEDFDGVINHFNEEGYFIDLEEWVQNYKRTRKPVLYIHSDKRRGDFVYKEVVMEGKDWVHELKLHEPRYGDLSTFNNVYEPTHRLLAEMGVAFRVGEELPQSESLYVGKPYPEGGRLWNQYKERFRQAQGLLIDLSPLKDKTEEDDMLIIQAFPPLGI